MQYKKYLDSYTNFTAMDEMVLVQMTNCRPSCQRTMYKTTKISRCDVELNRILITKQIFLVLV